MSSEYNCIHLTKETVTRRAEKMPEPRLITKPILFLDIDKVLNDQAYIDAADEYRRPKIWELSFAEYWARGIDPARVDRLNKAISGLDVQIVFSTAWRWIFSWQDLWEILRRLKGFEGTVIGATEKGGPCREEEIFSWLRANCLEPYPPYCAIDDLVEHFPTQLGGRLVATVEGMEEEHSLLLRSFLA